MKIEKKFIENNSKGSLILCEQCKKPLIERLPNGLWRFKFGRASLDAKRANELILSLKKLLDEILKIQKDLRIKSYDIDHRWSILERLIDLCPQIETSINAKTGMLENEIKIFNKLIKNINFKILKLYSRKDWIPVIMYIHGSIKMRCFRKDCGHWNVLNFLPNINDDFLQSVQD